ncbi:MAG: tetratricopeptide repeat protein [Chitinophagaceae bacterium]
MSFQQLITFGFSDIEQSTRLAQQLKEKYPEILDLHRQLIRKAIKNHKGKEIDTAGDGFFMTFEDPLAAVFAASQIQKELQVQNWAKEIGLKVRMGIHTGVALTTESGYTGIEVHRASRICAAAHGGQVLISHATEQNLSSLTSNELSLLCLGDFVLKDFDEPITLYQLKIQGLNKDFPRLRVNPEEKKIAVLPFTNQNKDPEQDYLGEGIAEEIIVALGKVPGLRVASRSTVFSIKNENTDARHIGRKLDVNSVLAGRIKSNNGQLHISAELVDTDSGMNIWSGQYDIAKNSLLYIQKEITRQITDALDCKLTAEHLNSLQQRQSQNAEAYDFYLRGRRFYMQFSTNEIELALQMFEKAIEADNTYALAYAGKADCYSFLYQHKERSDEIIKKADMMSLKGIELAPALAEVYVSRGIVLSQLQQFDEAEKLFQFAIEQDPTLFLGWYHYARSCFAVGKLDKAARLFEQANQVEPEDYQSVFLAAQSYSDIGINDLAKTLRQRGVEIAERRLELNPGETRALYLTANAYVFLDNHEKSKQLLKRALFLEPEDSMLLYNASCIYTLLGMKSEALNCLEKSYKAGLTLLGWYENDSNLDSLRDDPRFINLLSDIRKLFSKKLEEKNS